MECRRGSKLLCKTSPALVHSESQHLRASSAPLAVINATGRWSNLRSKQDDTVKLQPKWLGIKMYFAETSPRPSADLYFFDGGYCGVQPVAFRNSYSEHGQVNACAMVRTDVASNLTQVFAQHPALAERAGRWRSLSNLVSTFPLFFRDPQPVRDNVLQVGDSAGFVDPFVGDGISLALRSGSLAGESLIPFFRGEASLEHASQQYCRVYQQRFARCFAPRQRFAACCGCHAQSVERRYLCCSVPQGLPGI